jgi:NAD-dependent dihydropyrimidine dehydrogenase PreA subunit
MIKVVRIEACDGCGVCANNCPVGSLRVEAGKVVTREPEMCTDCRICVEVCPLQVLEAEDT